MPCVLLSQWELEADYFAQDFMSGIIPVLFAEDPKAAELAILADEYTAMKDLDRINRSFFIPESIDLEAAFKVVKKPRLGDAEYLFKTENLDRLFEQPPPRKGIYLMSSISKIKYLNCYQFCSWRSVNQNTLTVLTPINLISRLAH